MFREQNPFMVVPWYCTVRLVFSTIACVNGKLIERVQLRVAGWSAIDEKKLSFFPHSGLIRLSLSRWFQIKHWFDGVWQ